jgi:O-antigen/teichoic acid export membrane protein
MIEDDVSRSIISRSAKLVIANIVSIAFLFCTNFFLIKLLGEKQYGEYISINVWLSVLSIVILFGMDDLFVAVLPKNKNGSKGSAVPLIFKWALKICLSLLLIAVTFSAIYFLNSSYSEWYRQYGFSLILLLTMLVFFNLLNAFFRGLNHIVKGQILEKVVRSGVVLTGIVFFYLLQKKVDLNTALYIQAGSIFVCVVIFMVDFFKKFSFSFGPYNSFDASGRSNLEFLGISLLYFLSTRVDILILTAYSTSKQVGYYNIAARISDILGYPTAALYLILPTVLSKEWVADPRKAAGILKKIVQVSSAIILMGLVILLFSGKQILSFFGKNFVNSYWPMVFLSSIHLVSVFSLPLNTILMVSGRQKFSLIALLVYVLFVMLLSFFFVPKWGAPGAALTMLCGSLFYLFFIVGVSYKLLRKELGYS